jgi:competence protein ComEC
MSHSPDPYFDQFETEESFRTNTTLRRIILIGVLAVTLAAAVFFIFIVRGRTFGPTDVPEPTVPPSATSAALQGTDDTDGLLVIFLDVGQGDAIFLRSPSGKTMLIDGGPEGAFPVLQDYLDSHGVIGLDAVVASHLHADHIGGLIRLIDVYPVVQFYDPPFDAESETYYDLLDALNENNVPVLSPLASANSFIEWDDEVEIRILSPYGIDYGKIDDFNDTSYILRVTYQNTSVLLAGDATQVAEKLALKALPDSYFKADVLKVGHHGSNDATSEIFLDAVDPAFAVISCGEDNQYGHPDEELLSRLIKRNITIYRTDEDGSVTLLLDGINVKVIQ